MAQIFAKWTNKVPLITALTLAGATLVAILGTWYWASPKFTDVGYRPVQPVPFSHRLHAGDLGMDCRYCHTTVERAAGAAIPPTATCMNCHKTILPNSEKLALVRESAVTGKPIEWVRVHMLPDYAYFDHSVHVAAGVSCVSCHGRIDKMERVWQSQPLSMGWCLDCHNNPDANLRPRAEVTNMNWAPPAGGYDPHADPTRGRMPNPPIHCSGCHR
ncbi:cytochrome c3 family protein [bacterium]|nr:cytochrome c3 family protein [bacterium]